ASLGASFPGKQLEPTLTTLLPGRNHVVPYAHPGEEFTWVLEGTLTVLLGDKEYELGPGDCIHMPSTAPHGWENRTDKAVRVLCVSTPPVFQSSVSPNA
ncbi:MAG TPA: cupin domain-containing protein, partial [Symbiobacteriaceae bacterium]|nr:cupin domain-containing protein [Symbiobacteriaceae bacterium]